MYFRHSQCYQFFQFVSSILRNVSVDNICSCSCINNWCMLDYHINGSPASCSTFKYHAISLLFSICKVEGSYIKLKGKSMFFRKRDMIEIKYFYTFLYHLRWWWKPMLLTLTFVVQSCFTYHWYNVIVEKASFLNVSATAWSIYFASYLL